MEYTFNMSLCRLCFCYDVSFVDIFKDDASQEYNLTSVILELLELKVSEKDGYPKSLCSDCFKTIIDFKKFKKECQQAKITYDKNIRMQEVTDVYRRSQEIDNGIEETSVRPKFEFHIDNYDMWGNLITEDSEREVIVPAVVKKEDDLDQDYQPNATFRAAVIDDVDEYCNSIDRKTSVQDCLKCPMCGMEFDLLSQLDLHLKSHETNSPQVESSEIILDHVKEENYMSSGILSTDFEVNHESSPVEQAPEYIKPWKCLECQKEFSRECDYTHHLRVHKSVTSLTSEQNHESRFTRSIDLKQKEVNKVTLNVNLLQDQRKRTSDLESKCSKSNGTTSVVLFLNVTGSELDKSKEDKIECIQQGDSVIASEFQSGGMKTKEECISFDEEDVGCKLRNSDVKKREDNVDGVFSHYNCEHCSKVFNDIYRLNMHLSLHERDVSVEGEEVTSINTKVNNNANYIIRKISHNCRVCKKIFTGKSNLKVHMRTHSGEKPYKCHVCNQMFSQKNNRDRHMVHIHENYMCSYCHKLFYVKDKLAEHVQECRIKRVFSCKRCNMCFNDHLSHNDHLRTHMTEKVFKCQYCNKYFSRRDGVSLHERIHTRERPFICSVCGKSFSYQSNFIVHMRIHTNDKRYKCGDCNKSFVQSSSLRRHERTHTKDKPFRCSYCDKSYSDKSTVKQHEGSHQREKEFKYSV